MYRLGMCILTVVSLGVLVLPVQAEEEAKDVVGIVKSVDAEKMVFTLILGDGQFREMQIIITYDQDTKFLDPEGKEAPRVEVLKEQASVKVNQINCKALKVQLNKPPADKK